MFEQRTIIDLEGNIIEKSVLFKDGKPQYFDIGIGKEAVEYCKTDFVKPHWNGSAWEESATEEERKAWQDNNKIIQEPTAQEKLNAQLLIENAEIKKELVEQQKINANMLMQIAKLGGTQQ